MRVQNFKSVKDANLCNIPVTFNNSYNILNRQKHTQVFVELNNWTTNKKGED